MRHQLTSEIGAVALRPRILQVPGIDEFSRLIAGGGGQHGHAALLQLGEQCPIGHGTGIRIVKRRRAVAQRGNYQIYFAQTEEQILAKPPLAPGDR